MKVVIQIQIDEKTILNVMEKQLDKPETLEAVGEALQIKIGAAVKKEFAKTVVQICKDAKIPLGDLLTSKGGTK